MDLRLIEAARLCVKGDDLGGFPGIAEAWYHIFVPFTVDHEDTHQIAVAQLSCSVGDAFVRVKEEWLDESLRSLTTSMRACSVWDGRKFVMALSSVEKPSLA